MRQGAAAVSLRERFRFDGLWWRKFCYLGCVYGPEWWKRYSPPGFAAVIFALVGSHRRGAMENMRRVQQLTGTLSPARAALRVFCQFAHCLVETMEYYGPRPRPIRLDMPANDPLRHALQQGNGAVIVTGHFGNWDIAGKRLHEYGRPINMVMAREVNTSTRDYVQQARAAVGVNIIYSDSSVFSSLNMIRALRRNEIVALQLDRMLGGERSQRLPFFGAPAAFPTGPFMLARVASAPVLVVFVPRLGTRHYAIRVAGPFTPDRARGEQATIHRVMQEAVGVFESVVREFPTQWFQFQPFWSGADASARRATPSAQPARSEPLRARV
jgi:KDO2-lipid IV(A) lauroyltransferase